MSMTKRTQGRPPRNSGLSGRDRLIEATRIYLQSHRKMSITRTEIAQGCGVTPALISYYFKDKRSLLDAVTKPLVTSYKKRFDAIFALRQDAATKMKAVIQLLIELSCDNVFLIDVMLQGKDQDTLDSEDRLAVECFRCTITDLVRDLLNAKQWRVPDPALSELALWGMCRALGDTLRQPAAVPHSPQDVLQNRVDFVYDTFMTEGIGPIDRSVATEAAIQGMFSTAAPS